MDSLEWSKKYEVLSMSRLMLRDQLHFSTEQVNALSDEVMERMASWLENQFLDGGFMESVKFIVSLELAELEPSPAPKCDVCLTWIATHDVYVGNDVYHVCEKPRCQDKVAVLKDMDNQTGEQDGH